MDEIKGTAVMRKSNGATWLIVCCVASSGEAHYGHLPIRLRGTPESIPSWQYDLSADEKIIHVTPSVRLSKRRPIPGREDDFPKVGKDVEVFHNGADWRVKVVDWDKLPESVKTENDGEPYTYWRKLNKEYLA